MKLGIAYSSKDAVDNTRETFYAWYESAHRDTYDLHWVDGSDDADAIRLLNLNGSKVSSVHRNIRGGPDAAIAYKLTLLLDHPKKYTHIGILENDVLLDPDWYEPTMALFEKYRAEGLDVGAVSARSFVDRVLIQRDSYAVMHNVGAGMVIFTREAAKIVLHNFRTHWWSDNVRLFAHLSGIDLRTYAAFRGNEQWVTTDWGFEAQLARRGLASLALTPAKCKMIGQKISLADQGLELTTDDTDSFAQDDDKTFFIYHDNLQALRRGERKLERPQLLHRDGAGMLFFPHQLNALAGHVSWRGNLGLRWSQGFGPFAYRAGKDGASLSLDGSGICSFLVTCDIDGAKVRIEDQRSGFKAEPKLTMEMGVITITVPGSPVPRELMLEMEEGAIFCALQCNDPQMLDATFKFDWKQLPEAV